MSIFTNKVLIDWPYVRSLIEESMRQLSSVRVLVLEPFNS